MWFRCGLIVLPASYILSLCSQILPENKQYKIALLCIQITSGVIASKILYDRSIQVNILSALTTNPKVTSFANKVASLTALLMVLGFIVCLLLFVFEVDSYSVTALNICLCAFATLFMWMQGLITMYFSTLYFNRNVVALRHCLASFSTVVIVLMAVIGTISILLPRAANARDGVYVCAYITSICGYVVAAFFGLYIISFQKEYRYFAEGFDSDQLIDDTCSIDEPITSNAETISTYRSLCSDALVKSGTYSKYS